MNSETKQWEILDWERIFKSMTDPDAIAQTRRTIETEKRKEQKRKDTGL